MSTILIVLAVIAATDLLAVSWAVFGAQPAPESVERFADRELTQFDRPHLDLRWTELDDARRRRDLAQGSAR